MEYVTTQLSSHSLLIIQISGREMFEFNPELKGEGDDGEDDEETVVIQRQDDDEVQRSHLYSY